jgi:hypothetical protein
MNAAALLKELECCDVRLSVDKDRLIVDAPKGVITVTLAEKIRAQKTEVIKSLGSRDSQWTAEDWVEFFNERAAILEYDGELQRTEAERQAYETTVIQWMNETPPKGIDDDRCASCGHHIGDVGRDAVPFLSGGGGHVWLHHGCHPTWMTRRRSDAEKALTAMGVTSP